MRSQQFKPSISVSSLTSKYVVFTLLENWKCLPIVVFVPMQRCYPHSSSEYFNNNAYYKEWPICASWISGRSNWINRCDVNTGHHPNQQDGPGRNRQGLSRRDWFGYRRKAPVIKPGWNFVDNHERAIHNQLFEAQYLVWNSVQVSTICRNLIILAIKMRAATNGE